MPGTSALAEWTCALPKVRTLANPDPIAAQRDIQLGGAEQAKTGSGNAGCARHLQQAAQLGVSLYLQVVAFGRKPSRPAGGIGRSQGNRERV